MGKGKKRGDIMPQANYALPILEVLLDMGGSGATRDVLDRVFPKIKHQLKPRDLERLPSGKDIKWRNRAQWERLRLRIEGYIEKNSPQGIWEITDAGRKLYERLKQRE